MDTETQEQKTSAKADKCTCIEETQDRIMKFQQEKYPERKYEESSLYGELGFQNVALSLSIGVFLNFPFKSRYTFQKVNGETSKPKTDIVYIYPTYCPFCGRKIGGDKDE